MKNISAKKITKYLLIYIQYLVDNNLDDDSDTITVEDLIDFVENHIDDDEFIIYENLILKKLTLNNLL